MRGCFIALEGGDGCGKSTQIQLLQRYLVRRGRRVTITREPGGCRIAECVRELLLDENSADMLPETEALLYAAARAQHVRQVILPALREGNVVLCDRYVLSSLAYQGYGRELGEAAVREINRMATGGLWPDVTFLLSLPPEIAAERRAKRGRGDRVERAGDAFHRRVADGFCALAKRVPNLYAIDCSQDEERVFALIRARVDALLCEATP